VVEELDVVADAGSQELGVGLGRQRERLDDVGGVDALGARLVEQLERTLAVLPATHPCRSGQALEM
jgi:hypothetical protein